jgi:hypothetical protein
MAADCEAICAEHKALPDGDWPYRTMLLPICHHHGTHLTFELPRNAEIALARWSAWQGWHSVPLHPQTAPPRQ